jgi:heat-inducible transcriptional repressor
MTEGLTARQTQILKSLIDEYIQTAEPVGSETLDKKYNLGVSSATIRNEMATLTDMNFLRQPHTSAGRIPSPKAMKFYIDQLMEEKQMSLTEEVKAKEEVWDARNDIEELLDEATHALAERTRALAVACVQDGERIWHSGYANVFLNPEFTDLEATANVFSLLEEAQRLQDLFFKTMTGASPVEVVFGEELGWPGFRPIGFVGTRFSVAGKEGALGIIGPTRLPYSTVIPVLRYFKGLVQEVAGE